MSAGDVLRPAPGPPSEMRILPEIPLPQMRSTPDDKESWYDLQSLTLATNVIGDIQLPRVRLIHLLAFSTGGVLGPSANSRVALGSRGNFFNMLQGDTVRGWFRSLRCYGTGPSNIFTFLFSNDPDFDLAAWSGSAGVGRTTVIGGP